MAHGPVVHSHYHSLNKKNKVTWIEICFIW
jgi:hypothetical protein